jgi:hypothetical protein
MLTDARRHLRLRGWSRPVERQITADMQTGGACVGKHPPVPSSGEVRSTLTLASYVPSIAGGRACAA